jgi:phytanoyl-CoA hydroxylase
MPVDPPITTRFTLGAVITPEQRGFLRDLFYGRMPDEQLNVGLHLDRCARANGGLRLIPGSHRQGFWSMGFRRPYFVWHRPDPHEVCIETEPGDLTVHDGRLWHRAARSEQVGAASLRRSMYLPYLTGPYAPKSVESPTPAYHKVAERVRRRETRRRQGGMVAGCAR